MAGPVEVSDIGINEAWTAGGERRFELREDAGTDFAERIGADERPARSTARSSPPPSNSRFATSTADVPASTARSNAVPVTRERVDRESHRSKFISLSCRES